MSDLNDYPYDALVDEHIGMRIALKRYLEENLYLQRPDGETYPVEIKAFPSEPVDLANYPNMTFLDADGDWDASSNTPKILADTAWPDQAPEFVLVQDATWVEEFDIQVEGTDEIQISALVRVIREAMNPHEDRYGSLVLDLADLYYGRRARYSIYSARYLDAEDPEDKKKRVRVARIPVEVQVPTVKIIEVASSQAVQYAVSVE